MPRKPIPKPLGEHIATLARVQQAIEVAPKLDPKRAKRIKQHIGDAMAEIQAELVK